MAENKMPKLIGMIQTTWPKIRIGLYELDDGAFRYVEEGVHTRADGREFWYKYAVSKPFDSVMAARAAMLQYYCECVEDEYDVDPQSVTIREPPNFVGEHHPVLRGRK